MKLGLVGAGAIARSQHLPVIADHPNVDLVAVATHDGTVEGVPTYGSLGDMLAAHEDIEAVSLCVPPVPRFDLAREAIAKGRHVFLEKPPGTTLSEAKTLADAADEADVVLFASWHSRYAPAVETLKTRLEHTTIKTVRVVWKEDVRQWHPGQTWIWQPGGFGVFDPGINALSILTHVLPPFRLVSSVLWTPENCSAPIHAELAFVDVNGAPIDAEFNFDQAGPPSWDIEVETQAGRFVMSKGGAHLTHDGTSIVDVPEAEYRALYDRFLELVDIGVSDVDLAPLRHVADCFLRADNHTVGPFYEDRPATT